MYEDVLKFHSNSFEDDLLQGRKELFQKRQYADVTLVSDDMVPFHAHRTVLGSSSKLLNSLFELTKEPLQVLFLKGVSTVQLQSVLKFIYIGETSVKMDQVEEFSKVANELGITKLVSGNVPNQLNKGNKQVEKVTKLDFSFTERKPEIGANLDQQQVEKLDFLSPLDETLASIEDSDVLLDNNSAVNNENVDREHSSQESGDINSFFKKAALQFFHYPTENEEKLLQENVKQKEDSEESVSVNTESESKKQFTEVQKKRKELYLKRKPEEPSECPVCATVFTTQRSMQRHNKNVHELMNLNKYNCEECGKSLHNGIGLQRHIDSVHKKLKISCDICGIKFSLVHAKTTLRRHKEREHPPPKCDTCNIQFKTISEFNVHVQKEHIEKYCK